MSAEDSKRELDVIARRRYTLVAEWLGSRDEGQRTARWFYDQQTGTWYVAESWKRPNFLHPLNAEQVAYVESLLGSTCPTCGHATVTTHRDGSQTCGHCYMQAAHR